MIGKGKPNRAINLNNDKGHVGKAKFRSGFRLD